MLQKGKLKVISYVLATLMVLGVLSFSPCSVRTVDASEKIGDFDFEFSDMMLNIKRILHGFNQNFYDFETSRLTPDDYAAIANLAKIYVPFEYRSSDYYVIMAADDLIDFMKESFGIDLPKETFGVFYEYDADNDTFVWPDSDGWFDIEVFKINAAESNDDGSITLATDLYLVQTEHYYENLYEDLKKPVDDWDSRVFYAKIASPLITIKLNEDYRFFPFELVSVESDLIDWLDAQGTYESEDGKISLAFRVESSEYRQSILLTATNIKTNKQQKLSGYMSGNSAMFYMDDVYMIATLLTLTPDGGLILMDNPDTKLSVPMKGLYNKVSDEIPLQVFYYDYYVRTIHGVSDNDEQNIIGICGIPHVLGLNDEELEEEINDIIQATLSEGADEFEANYKAFLEEIEKEEDEELKKQLQYVAKRYSYESSIYYITGSDYYNVLAEFRTSYYGGAHNDLFIQIFNIDSEKKKLLTLGDIFDDEDWQEKLESILTEMSKTEFYKDLVYSDLEEIKIVNDKDFYLMEDNLLVFFQPYEIGPFTSHFVSFKIPLDDIKDMLREEYFYAEYKNYYSSDMFYNSWMFSVDV